ncbi:MAG: glutamate racemase [Rhodocyclaceae bacterium]|nr:glutamate racemase [Rhodocyclaceae bacterium]
MTADQPIGVFDSGVGGLSVLRQIRERLPGEDLLYVADSGHAPYGHRPAHAIEARSIAIGDFLLARGAKALVVACNTATAAAIHVIRARYGLPVVGIEPAVKPAVAATRSGVIGVLATHGTLKSPRFAGLVERFGAHARVMVQSCPGLVERIEAGDLESMETRRLLEAYVRPLLDGGADTLVLGCTHYPFLASLLAELAGPEVAVVEPGAAVARHLAHRLEESGLLRPRADGGTERFWTSGDLAQLNLLLPRLWPRPARAEAFTS